MQEDLVSFKTAKLAKEKGFNPPLDVYNDVFDLEDGQPMFNVHRDTLLSSKNTWILRPTQSLLQKWLRDVKDIYVNVILGSYSTKQKVVKEFRVVIFSWETGEFHFNFFTYEEALEKGLFEALKLIKNIG